MAACDLVVKTVDGECLPVPGLEIGVRYRYTDNPAAWSTAITDGDGIARFHDAHPEPPIDVEVFADGRHCDTHRMCESGEVVLHLEVVLEL